MKKNIIIGLAVLVIIIAGTFLLLPSQEKKTPEVQVPTVSTEEKEAIISAVIKQQEIYSSKDPKKIRAYFLAMAQSTNDKLSISSMKDKDILSLTGFGASFAEGITAEDLRGNNVNWSGVGEDIAVISINKGGKAVRFTVQKLNGIWY
jgi:hypothetical protein